MKKSERENSAQKSLKILFLTFALPILLLVHCQGKNQTGVAAEELQNFEKTVQSIKNLGLSSERAHHFLKLITSVGGRLTGSVQAAQAVELASGLMRDLGFDRVWTEPVQVSRWVRGQPEEAMVRSEKTGIRQLSICALGNSVGTPPDGLEARVVEITSFEQLALLKEKINGRIVFYNVPMDRTLTDSFLAYGQAAQFRVSGASWAAQYGARAMVIRSMTFRVNEFPHAGLMQYDEQSPKIPAAAISTADADRLQAWLKEDPELTLKLKMSCRQEEPVLSANVMGQITGIEKPEEIILVGGHLDSWDLGPGAHDDAAGCAVAIEVLRLIRESGLKPKRTVRAVLFMDEEFGGTGGRAYVRSAGRQKEKHLVAIEQDRGGFSPAGLAVSSDYLVNKLRLLEDYLRPLGINWIRQGGGGVDIAPLREQGVVLAGLIPDSHKYFDFHHCALDRPEAVHPRELELQAVVLAAIVYYLAQEGV